MHTFERVIWVFVGVMGTFLAIYLGLKLINKLFYGPRTNRVAKQEPSVHTATLKVLHYDVSWEPMLLSLGVGRFAGERAALLLDRLTTYDVVALNGCYSYIGSPVASFVRAMRRQGFRYVARSPSAGILSLEVMDGGVVIFSKFPILMQDSVQFSLSLGIDHWIGKGAVYARVQTGAGTHVHFFALTEQRSYADSMPECRAVRFAQMRETKCLLDNRASDGQPIILMGDLNIDARAPETRGRKTTNEYNRVLETLAKDSYAITDTMLETFNEHLPTYGDEELILTPKKDIGTQQRTDYIFVLNREGGEYTLTGQNTAIVKFDVKGKKFTHLSSHYGIESDMLFSLSQRSGTL
jgi:endonuclease/exonuclease/phosphatase family metal-dependent hydrolase